MGDIAWQAGKAYREIIYETAGGIAKISINRPERRNAFTPLTVTELYDAFSEARDDASVGVIILTGVNHGGRHEDEAFCSGGDQKIRGNGGYVGEDNIPRLNVLDLQRLIRVVPKPVIAMVNGYATSPSPPRLPSSARRARRWAASTPGTARAIWRTSWARRRRARSGISAASTRLPRRLRWAWSTKWFPSRIWKRSA